MKALWISDIHLEFLEEQQTERFLQQMKVCSSDCVLISGDIAQAPTVKDSLNRMEALLQCPIYFVLGNHDYYFGSISESRSSIHALSSESKYLRWLNQSGVINLTPKTTIIGHDSWGDGRLGDFWGSSVILNDFMLIKELKRQSRQTLLQHLNNFGEEAAAHFVEVLPKALETSDHIVVVTHVPPFREAAWYNGRYCDSDWLPFFSCKIVGDVLRKVMHNHPEKQMTVLCGHTHGGGTSNILPNLIVHTGPAEYGHPAIQKVFDWE